MAGMIYEFIDGLKAETELYKALTQLADDKRGYIIKGNIEKINELNGLEEKVVLKLKGFERKRNELMADIASILNENPQNITITRIVEALKGQPEEAAALNAVKEELSIALKALKAQNDENVVLINQSLDYAQFSINVLQSGLGTQPMNANYGGNEDKQGQSFFDTKQ